MDKKEMVSHHNNLTESYFNATEKELNLFISIIFKSKFANDNSTIIDYDFIKKYFNSKDKKFSTFENSLKNLQTKAIKIKISKDEYKSIIPFPTLHFDQKEKTIEVSINKDFLPYVQQIKGNFTKYSLEEFINLSSSHSKRIYQLIMQYEKIKERIIKLEELKKLLDCDTDYYKVFREFNQKILKKSVKEINKKTDLVVTYETIKYKSEGEPRPSTKEIQFKFYRKQQDIIEIAQESFSESLEKAITNAKKNIYVSKAWNKRVDTKLESLLKNKGEDFTKEILKDLYTNLKSEVNTTLVQYINGIIKNKKMEVAEVVPKEKELKKEKKEAPEVVEIKEVDELTNHKAEISKILVRKKNFKIIGEIENIDSLVELKEFVEKNNIDYQIDDYPQQFNIDIDGNISDESILEIPEKEQQQEKELIEKLDKLKERVKKHFENKLSLLNKLELFEELETLFDEKEISDCLSKFEKLKI